MLASTLTAWAAVAAAAPLGASRGLDPGKALTQYNLDIWTTADDLPQNSVTALAQTSDGYLWLGTYGGLVRFDGVRFTVFDRSNTPALKNNGIQALLADRDGGLWIGTNGGGLSRHKDGAFRTFSAADGLGSDIVRALHQDRSGALWIGTAEGLARWSQDRFSVFTTKDGLSNDVVRAIEEDAQGVLWIGTNGGGVDRFDGRSFRRLTTRDGLPSDFVFALLRGSDGAVWIGTNGGGLCRFKDGRLRTFTTRDGLPSNIIWSLHEDALGSLWVGTYGGGLARLRDGRVSVLGTRHGLSNDFVRTLLSDREGSLWVGTYSGGLCRLRDGKFTTYTTREGLGHDFARTLLEDRDGSVWVGTTGGGLCRMHAGGFRCYDARQGLSDDVLYQDAQGSLWIGTAGAGLFRLEGDRFTRHTTAQGLAHDNVAAIAADRSGGLWIGTNGGGLSHFVNGRWSTYSTEAGLAGNFVLTVHVDRSGSVWAGTDGAGLARLKDGRFTTFTRKDGLAGEIVFSLYEDRDGVLWIGTASGLSRFRDGAFVSFTTREGLVDDVVFQILEDDARRLWLSGNKGISRVERADLDAVAAGRKPMLAPVAYGVADGMKSNECGGIAQPAGFKGKGGRLWFPTVRGIVMVDPTRLPLNALPPPVLIEQATVDGSPLASFDVPPGRQRWEFHYTALSFLAPRKVRFRYKLEGFDPDWVDAGTRRTAYYTRLPPGSYTFRAVACNNDGVWNEEGAALKLRVQPHFYETAWFYGLVAVVLTTSAAAAYWMRVRSLHAHRRELEVLVEARTHDLLLEKERSEAARAEAERQKDIAEQADRMKSELLSIAAHDLKTPLQTILGYAELTLAPEGSSRAAEYASYGALAAQRMLQIVRELLQTDALERGGLTPSRRAFDLGRLALTVIEDLKPQAAAKRQTIHATTAAPCVVEADEEWLQQVIENLLDNAIKYSPHGRPIWLDVRGSDGKVLLEVRDEGPGLMAEDMPKLFGRFQRLSARPTGGESSTGLGLHIVRQLVERQAGRVWAESDGPGRGARFVVELPAGDGRPG